MLKLMVQGGECYNESTGEILTIEPTLVKLEHSLLACSKWESFFKKPFLTEEKKSREESLYYIECMLLEEYDPNLLLFLTESNLSEIETYIADSQTATTIRRDKQYGPKKVVTTELIYYWMTALNIPFECERWNLNRLMMLIEVASIKNNPKSKKKGFGSSRPDFRSINAARRKASGSTG